jgi:hypothetical protein
MKYALTTILGILMIAFVTTSNHEGSNQTHYIYETKNIEEHNTTTVDSDEIYKVDNHLKEDIML